MQGWPQWIRPQVLRLKLFTLGSIWEDLVLLWLEIEKELGFPTEVGISYAYISSDNQSYGFIIREKLFPAKTAQR
jgi:hypothetical protein